MTMSRRVVAVSLGTAIVLAILVGTSAARAGGIATTWSGAWRSPSLTMTATCSSHGPEAVWIAQTGLAFLDVIQVGTWAGQYFYAYGRGAIGAPGSLYVEHRWGHPGTGWHRFDLALKAHLWTMRVDGAVVARISDRFRTWRLHESQVMAEGDLPFGPASCRLAPGHWWYGGYGPQPDNLDWSVS